jgi:hypothetical protein
MIGGFAGSKKPVLLPIRPRVQRLWKTPLLDDPSVGNLVANTERYTLKLPYFLRQTIRRRSHGDGL